MSFLFRTQRVVSVRTTISAMPTVVAMLRSPLVIDRVCAVRSSEQTPPHTVPALVIVPPGRHTQGRGANFLRLSQGG